MNEILLISQEIKPLIDEWEPKLLSLTEEGHSINKYKI